MTPTDAPRARAKPMSPEERRATIVEATVPLVIEHGATVTTRLIAEAAGVAEGTIFRVFDDKRALFHAVAEHVISPPGSTSDLADELEGMTTLGERVVHVVRRMEARSHRAMAVMMALRQVWMGDGPPARTDGPPEFLVRSQQRLLDDLTLVLFAPYADQLRVGPQEAALALRALVLGGRHPGMHGHQERLSPEQVADIVLNGVARVERGEG